MPVKSIARSEFLKLRRWYDEQLKVRDRQIEDLRKENEAILKSAISQAQRSREWESVARNFEKRLKR